MTVAYNIFFYSLYIPYAAFGLVQYRVQRFLRKPVQETRLAYTRPSPLTEFLLATPLLLLGILLAVREGESFINRILPSPVLTTLMIAVGFSHLVSLLWGTKRQRLVCAFLESWLYLVLLIIFGALSNSPRLAVAYFLPCFVASMLTVLALRR